jgi:curved DNA-binding protein CbpA
LLQQPKNASFTELKFRYRAEVKKCHPDALTGDVNNAKAVAYFQKINEAWKQALPALQREHDRINFF